MKIKFEPIDKSANLTRVSHGEYTLDLTGKEPPYEVDEDEWNKFLKPTGLFQIVTAPPPKTA